MSILATTQRNYSLQQPRWVCPFRYLCLSGTLPGAHPPGCRPLRPHRHTLPACLPPLLPHTPCCSQYPPSPSSCCASTALSPPRQTLCLTYLSHRTCRCRGTAGPLDTWQPPPALSSRPTYLPPPPLPAHADAGALQAHHVLDTWQRAGHARPPQRHHPLPAHVTPAQQAYDSASVSYNNGPSLDVRGSHPRLIRYRVLTAVINV